MKIIDKIAVDRLSRKLSKAMLALTDEQLQLFEKAILKAIRDEYRKRGYSK